MKCKEFLKIASNFRDGLMDGVRKAFRVHSPSSNKVMPGTCVDIGTAIRVTEQAVKEAHPEMTKPESRDDFIQAVTAMRDAGKSPVQEVADTLNRAAMSCGEIGERARDLIRALGEFGESMSLQRFAREQTNNWKKIHGLPMRRRTLQERKRKNVSNDIRRNHRGTKKK